METVVVVVAGMGGHGVAEEVWRASPGSVLVRHDLSALSSGLVRRWVDGVLTELVLEHGCVSCTLREDMLPLLASLGGRVVLDLDPALEPEAVCLALADQPVRVETVIGVVDRATWLADATGDATLGERGIGLPSDERTVAQVVIGHAEFADALVLTGPGGDDVLTAVLDRVAPGTPRFELSSLDASALTSVPVGRRFTPAFGPLSRGVPVEPAAGVSVVRFAARRPFHPMRLHDALDVLLDGVVRARGRVWVISQPSRVMWLESAGGGLGVGAVGTWLAELDDWSTVDPERCAFASLDWDPDFGDRAQEVVAVCLRDTGEAVLAALRDALVTDEELALRDELEFVDPFSEWHEMEEL
ncbi:CobW family GTP-binding protein [Saccharothrix hoggarensis]|uniref:GTP-binding protein n=1 Tax=Saccharothrix hoggarensis TaxID=913853 RepID=A0ABW3QYP7_9PSEU